MIMFLVFIVVLALPPLWLFAKTRPSTTHVDTLRRFNACAWFLTLFAGSVVWIYARSQGPADSPYLAIVAGVALASTVLTLGALVRFLVFRRLEFQRKQNA
jgi:hypothetical protein